MPPSISFLSSHRSFTPSPRFWSEGLWRPQDLRLAEAPTSIALDRPGVERSVAPRRRPCEGTEERGERRPRYDLHFDLKHLQGRWSTRRFQRGDKGTRAEGGALGDWSDRSGVKVNTRVE